MVFDSQDRALAMTGVALIITVGEPRLDLSQIACTDRLAALRAQGLPKGRPAVHQDESHVASPNATQMMVSGG
jgi:hypothetical protein